MLKELNRNETIVYNSAYSLRESLCKKLVQHLGFKDLNDFETKLTPDEVQQKMVSFYQELLDDEQKREHLNSLSPLKKPTITMEKLQKAMNGRKKNTIVKNLL